MSNDSKLIIKSLIKLSKLAEREQRIKNKPNMYIKPGIAGAFYINNTTQIITQHYGILIKGKIKNLQMVPKQAKLILNLENIVKKDETYVLDNNIYKKKIKLNLKNNKNYIYETSYNSYPEDQIKLILDCLDKPLIYTPNQYGKVLIIEGNNGIGVVTPLYK